MAAYAHATIGGVSPPSFRRPFLVSMGVFVWLLLLCYSSLLDVCKMGGLKAGKFRVIFVCVVTYQ